MRWREKVKEDGWGGREQADIRAGTEAVIAMGVAPADRIAVAGNSYGGFSSWFAITRHADLVILDKNPLKVDHMAIKDIRVLETIKDGKTIYRREL